MEECEYWGILADRFKGIGCEVLWVDGDHDYLKTGLNVKSRAGEFNIGSFAENLFNDLVQQSSDYSSSAGLGLIEKLASKSVVRGLSKYDTVILANEDKMICDGIEIFDPEKTIERVCMLGTENVLLSEKKGIASDLNYISGQLSKKRNDPDRAYDAPYRKDQKYVHAVREERISVAELYRRAENFFASTVPHLEEKIDDYKAEEDKLLVKMGLNPNSASPYHKLIHAVFSDGSASDQSTEYAPRFDSITYHFFGAKHKLFANHLIGKDILRKIEVTRFARKEDDSILGTEWGKRANMRIPGIIYNLAGSEANDPTQGVYIELDVKDLSQKEKKRIVDRSLKVFRPILFSETAYRMMNHKNPFDVVLDDLRWVIAILDESKLDCDVLEGRLVTGNRKVSIINYDDPICPEIVGEKMKKVKIFVEQDGTELPIHTMNMALSMDIPSGTKMKALLKYDQNDFGFDYEAASPFWIG